MNVVKAAHLLICSAGLRADTHTPTHHNYVHLLQSMAEKFKQIYTRQECSAAYVYVCLCSVR